MGHFVPHFMGHLVPPAVWAEGQGINRFSSQDGGCWTRTEPCLWEMEMGHKKPGYKQTPQPKCKGGIFPIRRALHGRLILLASTHLILQLC